MDYRLQLHSQSCCEQLKLEISKKSNIFLANKCSALLTHNNGLQAHTKFSVSFEEFMLTMFLYSRLYSDWSILYFIFSINALVS